jgi:hypothetical protein
MNVAHLAQLLVTTIEILVGALGLFREVLLLILERGPKFLAGLA